MRKRILVPLAAAVCAWMGMRECPAKPEHDKQWRAIHIGCSSDDDLRALGKQMPGLADIGINVLIVEVNYGFEYQSHPELRAGKKPVTKGSARKLAETCRAHGIRVVPQFQCVAHQSGVNGGPTGPLLTRYPEFDLTPGAFPGNKGIYCREWDPLNPKVNRIVFALIDELIDAFQADAFHVGMDEVFLLGNRHSPSTRGKDPARIFAKAVNDYHGHLVKKRGVEMLMWGDRLIDGKKFKFGPNSSSLCGTAPAVDMIPNDIIICDWQYELRPAYGEIPMFIKKGFRVLTSTHDSIPATRGLLNYSREQESPRILGNIFTTWGLNRATWTMRNGEKHYPLPEFPPIVAGLELLLKNGKPGK